jgi:hypothetical protein
MKLEADVRIDEQSGEEVSYRKGGQRSFIRPTVWSHISTKPRS